jgi:hypothetical protein
MLVMRKLGRDILRMGSRVGETVGEELECQISVDSAWDFGAAEERRSWLLAYATANGTDAQAARRASRARA